MPSIFPNGHNHGDSISKFACFSQRHQRPADQARASPGIMKGSRPRRRPCSSCRPGLGRRRTLPLWPFCLDTSIEIAGRSWSATSAAKADETRSAHRGAETLRHRETVALLELVLVYRFGRYFPGIRTVRPQFTSSPSLAFRAPGLRPVSIPLVLPRIGRRGS